MSGMLNMHQTADAVGLSYDRFRKVWETWVRDLGFPAPVWGHRWAREAVGDWITARSGRRVPPPLPAPAKAPRPLGRIEALRTS